MSNKKDCVFCKIIKKEIKTDFIYENDNFVVFLDQNQDIKGHALIVPKKHYTNSMDMPASLGTELLDAVKNTADKFFKDKKSDGFNIIQNNFSSAGQLVMHAHFHFLPRNKGDRHNIGVK